ncbi:solute carrier family 2 member 11, like isoform X3 [Hypomesus transpacificus]|uniref:solute carrier family 2 member 11, like isoform X3 n=1 Tax=Hypomesus transpacificus TaxID=137520 RepID=UPI001F07B7B8|nr:solute carrier family 2 member 11, like isoform X3 [Hypomesus transpacificus]
MESLPPLCRKRCLLFNNFVAISAAVLMLLSKTAMSFEMILVGRFLYGINAGVSLSVHTMYLVECAPKRLRGMVGVSVATFVSLGKFCGQLLGLSELLGTETGWPWLLAFCGATATLQLLTLPLLPESPRYLLLERGDRQGCEQAVRRLWGSSRDHGEEVEEMLQEHAAQQGVRTHTVLEFLLERTLRWQLATVLVTFSALQLCGINAVYLYSFDVFREAGIPAHQLRHVALGTGLCEISVSLACCPGRMGKQIWSWTYWLRTTHWLLWDHSASVWYVGVVCSGAQTGNPVCFLYLLQVMVIESTGKKLLLFRGLLCMAATLGLLTITLYLQTQVSWMPYCSMALIFLFILFFSSGPAGVTAPLPGEIFTQSFKPAAFTVGCTLNWTGLFLLGMLFPLIVEYLDYFCFLIFLGVCLLSGLFVWYNVPETKNRTVLEITADFYRMHSKTGLSEEAKPKQPEATGTVSSCKTTKL